MNLNIAETSASLKTSGTKTQVNFSTFTHILGQIAPDPLKN